MKNLKVSEVQPIVNVIKYNIHVKQYVQKLVIFYNIHISFIIIKRVPCP